MKRTTLITGGAGFVGSNLAIFLKKRFKNDNIICLDNLKREGSSLNIPRLKDAGIKFVKADIRKKKDLLSLPKIDYLIECSAEPSVLAGYQDPQYTIDTNLIGTIHCLELAKRDQAKFIFLSTSRVYPIESLNRLNFVEHATRFDWKKNVQGVGYTYQGIKEDFPLEGFRSLYGTTKLCSEHLIFEYRDIFSLEAVVNRLGVIAGPWQMGRVDQGIIGYWLIKHKLGGRLSYIGYEGKGKQVRDVVHIDDVCELIDYQIRHMKKINGCLFNAGGGRKNTISLLELTRLIQDITKIKIPIEAVSKERKADVRIYMTDNTKITKITGWHPQKTLEDIIVDMNVWIDQYARKLRKVLDH